MKAYIVWIKDVSRRDLAQVGGKGANLGELVKASLQVPNAFVVTARAYFDFIAQNKLAGLIKKQLKDLNPEDSRQLQQAAQQIQAAFLKAKLPIGLTEAVKKAYQKLGSATDRSPLVAIRSSATAEDLPEASFAGQQETFLNVSGAQQVVNALLHAYASLFGARAIYYRQLHHFDQLKVGLAVPVQLMVASERSGIMFTTDPVTGNDDEIVIEGGLGLGEAIVSGSVNPDRYVVAKSEKKILAKEIGRQAFQIVGRGEKNIHVSLSAKEQQSQKLTDDQILELRESALRIERHYGAPQDVEWAIGPLANSAKTASQLYFVQSRPITTLKKNQDKQSSGGGLKPGDLGEKLLTGVASSVGVASGPVKIIGSPNEIDQLKEGEVLVTEMTNPSYVPAMRRAVAIVTDTGGATSHAAIVSRELGKPAVVGTREATHRLKDGMLVTVDGAAGVVYKGKIEKSAVSAHHARVSNPATGQGFTGVSPATHAEAVPITATKVYVNIAEPSEAARVAALPSDGVGLLRAEFMIATLGQHPRALYEAGKSREYVKALTDGMNTIAGAFAPRPVVYRASDFKTNEYRALQGGSRYEPKEENPMLGYRGAMRYIKEPELFALELKALKEVRDRQERRNLHLMIPFVRSVGELRRVQELIAKSGLRRGKDFKLWIMVEVPAAVLLIDQLCHEGIDGVSVGSNDLTQLTLGIDRDNGNLAEEFDERDEAVLKSLERVVRVAHQHGITSSICGNAVSVYPEVVETVVHAGGTSVSVTPDRVIATRQLVASIEKKMVLNKIVDSGFKHHHGG